MMNKSKNTYTLSILAAGCLWGFMGLFRRYMGEAGFSSSGVIVLRCGVAALCFALTLLLTGPSQFLCGCGTPGAFSAAAS